METMFIPAKHKTKLDVGLLKEIEEKLPDKIAICYSIQFKFLAEEIKSRIDKEVIDFVQVLGCSNPKFKKDVEAILLIGQGKFHSVSLAYESKIPVYLIENNFLNEVSTKEIEIMEKKEKGAYLKYLNAEKVGILISTKPGQQKLKRAIELKNKIKDKKSYLFIGNELNVNEFENFGIDSWINTACPRMDLNDSLIININKLNL
ncbi:hypothetical protein HOD29_03655 [archaeon]|jgi:2-(3-amino-3-carboxypropyl)histidine synthase|nr:hypothetical protein [archaeon]